MVKIDGGAKITIAMGSPGAADPRGVSVDTQYIYWVNTLPPYNVQRALKEADASVTPLATNYEWPTATVVSANVIWWTDKTLGKINRCTLPACSETSKDLHTGLTEPDVLAQSPQRIFYNSANTIYQMDKGVPSGVGAVGAVVADNQSLPVVMAADDREFYWINVGDYQQSWLDGDIRRCPIVTGAADCSATRDAGGEVIAKPGARMGRGLALDGTAVYWTEQHSGVYRLAR
jgi:hypothetical protein